MTTPPLVVIDADVLGRRRTGDETYVRGLLRELVRVEDLRFAAVTRRPELVPAGIEPIGLPARSQVARMTAGMPRVLRRLRPRLAHFQHALPLGCPCPAIVTVHDLSFERDPSVMGRRDRLIFGAVVPRAARRAARVIAVSERTKRDLIELYRIPEEKIVVIPNGVDPLFTADGPRPDGGYALVVGALQPRKDPKVAIDAVALLGNGELRLVFAGPDRGGRAEAERAAERAGLHDRVEFRGYVSQDELASLYRGAACLIFPSRYEGFGLPALEAMASGTPVVATSAGALPEVAGDAAILVPERDPVALAGGIERALADRDRLVRAGLQRARRYSWAETMRRTLAVYRELV
ncbi:MAG TPA: glycosyltransferase family 1 protein [Gaiellaceae bacterium]|nr:glycosyltransferase family 1 protein [Gaiellaceae bacterium]